MNEFIRSMQVKSTTTENGMPTHTTSGNYCLDLFGAAGATRGWSEETIISTFSKALAENPLLAMKILFWARDVRGGAGERRFFQVCSRYLALYHPEYIQRFVDLIPEYGRWDDVFNLHGYAVDDEVLSSIKVGLAAKDGLLAKWLPRKGPFANVVRKSLDLTPKQYRKLIVGLSSTVEQDMCAKNWSDITYEHVPSQAMNKYRKAYFRNDGERFGKFIEAVSKGETEIKAGTLFPYQLYLAYRKREDKKAVEAQWNSLPNFMEGATERIMPLCDVSGSMHSFGMAYPQRSGPGGVTPMAVSVSLGIYISERNEGPYKDCFMTFSSKPTLQVLKGSFYDRCSQLEKARWEMNTDLEASFRLMLDSAVRHSVPADKMPTMLLIISDMQFDQCVRNRDNTAMEMIDREYQSAGYIRPKVVFWNVNAKAGQSPVRYTDNGTAVISGFTPAVLKSVLNGTVTDPVFAMMNAVMTERYEAITI